MTPKYLSKIKATAESGLLSLAGNRMLIELLDEGEKVSASGLVTQLAKETKSHSVADKARVAVVLATGPGYETEAGEMVDVPYKVGDYVLINQFAVKTFGDFFGLPEYKADSIGLITDDLVQARISDFTAFNKTLRG